jgi:hypothetical protein
LLKQYYTEEKHIFQEWMNGPKSDFNMGMLVQRCTVATGQSTLC